MSTSPADPQPTHDGNGKFAPGNRLGRGNPMQRAIQQGRIQLVREVKRTGAIPKATKVLMRMAIRGTRTVRYRERYTDPVTGQAKTRRVVKTMPVGDKVQLVALAELFSRFMGKATEFKVIEDHRPTDGSGATDLASLVASFIVLGLPQEMWPPQAREYHAKQVAAKVIEGDGPASPTE